MTGYLVRDVRRIAVLRPNAVGDFVFCLPALHALRHRYPRAEITYLGLPWHASFLAGRTGLVDHVVVVPPIAGITAPAIGSCDGREQTLFIDQMRAQRFDLALQMYGGGRYANPLVRQLGARLTAGMRTADAAPLDRTIAYAGPVNRRLQLLEVAALAGASYWPMKRELEATAADLQLSRDLIPDEDGRRLVLIQPGASDPRRRWHPQRFAAVADALAAAGARVVINGSERERPLAHAVAGRMRHGVINIAGKATLAALVGTLARSALVVSNDTGPLHLALALGRPCVGIYWLTNLLESAPLQQDHHRAILACRLSCPVCGANNLAKRCAHDASFVDDITLGEVVAPAIDMFRRVLD
ncbi:glycosyltransferase family 9 protein [Massilia sp. PAMC28688]|uniref:glycosyltransferase family 9 protein n=1 Tax=Massilia sp. PAMC28688 TaxID=2861283 RepID=UPI001C62A23F|nr:glycosyltransferase family 9 protein [Massilia sp. PAMC28688]QYF95394.1 glycosyltransferase family 9 protein [Massilia sp. PAMC28688]